MCVCVDGGGERVAVCVCVERGGTGGVGGRGGGMSTQTGKTLSTAVGWNCPAIDTFLASVYRASETLSSKRATVHYNEVGVYRNVA